MSKSRIKILVIINSIFGYDGISSVATNYYLYQDRNSVAMDLVTINPIFDDLKKSIEANGDHSYVLDYRNKNPLKYMANLKRIIKSNNYDIVHVHGNSATMVVELLAARQAGCKVRIAHSHNTQCDHQKLNKILMPVFSHQYTDCCACSNEAGRFLFGDRECYVVNNGLDVQKYRFNKEIRDKIRDKTGLTGKYVIGNIGRFRFQKNQEYLVKILAGIKKRRENAVLLLVGAGETEEIVKKQAVSMGLADSVLFYGTTDKVYEIVQAMDVFAFPSRFEGLGIVAIEAQASGLNCVASDAVPRTIAIQDGVRFIPIEGEDDKWIASLNELEVTPEERRKIASNTEARLIANGYDIKKNCEDILAFYERILSTKG